MANPQETGSAWVSLAEDDPYYGEFNGAGLEVISAGTVAYDGPVKVVLQALMVINGVRDFMGLYVTAVPLDEQYVDDGSGIGNCLPNRLEMADLPQEQWPLLHSAHGRFVTIANYVSGFDPEQLDTSMIEFTDNGTVAKISEFGKYVFVDTAPVVSIQVATSKGYAIVDLNGTSDEGQGGEFVLENLTLSVTNHAFAPVSGFAHLRISEMPFAPGNYQLAGEVIGLEGSEYDIAPVVLNFDVPAP